MAAAGKNSSLPRKNEGEIRMNTKKLKHAVAACLTAGAVAFLPAPKAEAVDLGGVFDVLVPVVGAYSAQLHALLDMGSSAGLQNEMFSYRLATGGGQYRGPDAAIVDEVMRRLLDKGDYAIRRESLPFRWAVSNDAEINAACDFSDGIIVNKGLLDAIGGQRDLLAATLSHEMVHGLNQHVAYINAEQTLVSAVVQNFRMKQGTLRDIVERAIPFATIKMTNVAEEMEADQEGFQLMTSAGYNPGGMAAMFDVLVMGNGPSFLEEFLLGRINDHPNEQKRISRAAKWMSDYGLGHVTVRNGSEVWVNEQYLLTAGATEALTAPQHAFLIAGGLSKGFHDCRLATMWNFTPAGDFLTDDDAYRYARAAVRGAGKTAALEGMVNASYAADAKTSKRTELTEAEEKLRSHNERERAGALGKWDKERVSRCAENVKTYRNLGLHDLARFEAQRYVDRKGSNDRQKNWGLNELGRTFMGEGKYEQAIPYLEQAITFNPKDVYPYYNMGISYKHLGQYDKAIACYEKAVALKPDYASVYNNMGDTYRILGQYDKAIACCEKAIALKQDYAYAYDTLGETYQDMGNREKARAYYEITLTLDPDHEVTKKKLRALDEGE